MNREIQCEFHTAKATESQQIGAFFADGGSVICQYSVGALFALAHKFDTHIAYTDNYMFVRSPGRAPNGYESYLMPRSSHHMSAAEVQDCVEFLKMQSALTGRRLMIWGALPSDIAVLSESGFAFREESDRNWHDYVYRLSDIAELPNPDYRKRRTAVKKFERDYAGRFEFRSMQLSDVPRVRTFADNWLANRRSQPHENDDISDLEIERVQIDRLLNEWNALAVSGAYVMVDDSVAGFTLAVPLGTDSYDMTTLKVASDISNVTPFLVRRFAETLLPNGKFINFEEDLGIPGLRKFKSDFHPFQMLEKHMVYFDGE